MEMNNKKCDYYFQENKTKPKLRENCTWHSSCDFKYSCPYLILKNSEEENTNSSKLKELKVA